jgi:hypothetical protein
MTTAITTLSTAITACYAPARLSRRVRTWILRGNFELGLQPMYIHLDEKPTAKDVYGATFAMPWLLAGNGTLRPYVEGARARSGAVRAPARATARLTSSRRAARAS